MIPGSDGVTSDSGTSGGGLHPTPTVRAHTDTTRFLPVLVVGLTGGIGSGKSTVSAMLADHGAVVIDADAITRELQEPGTEVFTAMVDRFGQHIVAADGSLDRQAVADMVFNDPDALADLNAIVHPAVGLEIANRLAAAADAPVPAGATAPIVVLDVPLLVETGRTDMAAVIVVDTHPDVQMHRLVNQRGLDAADAAARMARQATRQQRLDRADHVIDNTSDLDHLRAETDRVWTQLCELQASSDS
jgi:dephospho-CoA kinase